MPEKILRKGVPGMEVSEKTALLAIFINLAIFSVKYISAAVSGSIALKAEAFHTLADLVSSLTIFAGLKIAKRKTRIFPYGLYKIENLLSVVIALAIFYSGYEIILEVLSAESGELRNSGLAIFSVLFALVLTFWFSGYEKKIGLKINSPILLADAAHIRSDVLSNGVVLLAVVSSLLGYHLDKAAALIVVVFIARTGLQILIDGAKVLLDASVDYETLSKIEKIILKTPQVVELKTLTGRNSGRFKFIEANIVLKTHDLDKAHFLVQKIEKLIQAEIKNIDQILIHYEPLQKAEIIYALPLSDDQVSISSHFGEATYLMLMTFKAGEKAKAQVEIITNPFVNIEKGKGILLAEYLAKKMVDIVLLKKDFSSKGPAYVFANANIEVILTEAQTPQEALTNLGLAVSQPADSQAEK
jgi:cation diffusion facilitator family transporter